MITPFSQVGGLSWDNSYVGWYVTWPFARIMISDVSLEVRVRVPLLSSRCYTYAPHELRLTAVCKGFRRGLQIESDAATIPHQVTFGTFDPPALFAALQQFGYSVTESQNP